MPTHARKRHPHLRSIPGGKGHEKPSAVGDLFSGRVHRTEEGRVKRRKHEAPPQEIPKRLQPIANLFVAGRVVEKEIKFKADYARQEIDRFCMRDYIRRYIAANRRPGSTEYVAIHARFKFVMTTRTTMTVEKAETLKDLNIPIDEYTELRDMQIDYDAVRQHGLQKKLIQALESLHVPKAVLDECFVPQVELKETFYDLLLEIVRNSLKKGENIEDKMYEVYEILSPAEQIRNTEAIGLDPRQCFDLVYRSKIEASEDLEETDEEKESS